MAEGGYYQEKLFKLTDSGGLKKVLAYQHSYRDFIQKCKRKFGIPESEEVIFETDDGYEVDEEAIPGMKNLSILVLRTKQAHVKEESTDVTVTTLDDWSNTDIENITKESTDVTVTTLDDWSNTDIENITKGSDEIIRSLNESGTENVQEYVQATVDSWKYSPLNICVTGSSGNGKSYLINALRDVKNPNDGSFARSGTIETTCECKAYPHPKYGNIILWDVPGVGSNQTPKKTYLSDIKFDRYDFFLICSCSRFKKKDTWLADEILKRYKRFYFLRTKVDSDLKSAYHDKHKEFNEQTELKIIRDNCKSYLPENAPCFLISSYYPEKYDFPLLLQRLVDDAPLEQKHALVLGLCLSSKKSIERKAQFLGGEIWKIAFLSGVGGAFPLPGLSFVVDIALILKTANSYREHFKLTEEEVENFATNTGLSKELFKRAADLKLKSYMFTYSDIASMITAFASESVVEETIVVIPVIGSVVAATISYIVTGRILKKLLDDCKEDALKVFDFVAKSQSSIE